jgi:hypothetical protein
MEAVSTNIKWIKMKNYSPIVFHEVLDSVGNEGACKILNSMRTLQFFKGEVNCMLPMCMFLCDL